MCMEELRRPHLMLSHIRDADRILIHQCAHPADECLGRLLRPFHVKGCARSTALRRPRAEASSIRREHAHRRNERGQRSAQIAEHGEIDTHFLFSPGINVKNARCAPWAQTLQCSPLRRSL